MRRRLCGDVLLAEAMPGTPDGQVRVYPSTLSSLVASVEACCATGGLLRAGLQRQLPNVMVLRFAQKSRGQRCPPAGPRQPADGRGATKKLVGYETNTRGYGGSAAARARGADGLRLMEFSDMQPVYHDLDKTMLTRTASG